MFPGSFREKNRFSIANYNFHISEKLLIFQIPPFIFSIFLKWQLSKGIFPSGNFPNVQFPKRQLPKSVLAAALGPQPLLALVPHCSLWRLRGSNQFFWGKYLTPLFYSFAIKIKSQEQCVLILEINFSLKNNLISCK